MGYIKRVFFYLFTFRTIDKHKKLSLPALSFPEFYNTLCINIDTYKNIYLTIRIVYCRIFIASYFSIEMGYDLSGSVFIEGLSIKAYPNSEMYFTYFPSWRYCFLLNMRLLKPETYKEKQIASHFLTLLPKL